MVPCRVIEKHCLHPFYPLTHQYMSSLILLECTHIKFAFTITFAHHCIKGSQAAPCLAATARFLESDLIEILRRSSKEPVEGAVHK